VLDSLHEPPFDHIVHICCELFAAPIVAVSLITETRQWFKSKIGINAPETSRAMSFCAWTFVPSAPETLVVYDTHEDQRFKDHPMVVGSPGLRFYAGAPILLRGGLRVGAICVADTVPRDAKTFSRGEEQFLVNMAAIVAQEMSKALDHGDGTPKTKMEVQLRPEIQCEQRLRLVGREAIMIVDISQVTLPVLYMNDCLAQLCHFDADQCTCAAANVSFWAMFWCSDVMASPELFLLRLRESSVMSGRLTATHTGKKFWCRFKRVTEPHDVHCGSIRLSSGVTNKGSSLKDLYFVTILKDDAEPEQDAQECSKVKEVGLPEAPLMRDVSLVRCIGIGRCSRVYEASWLGSPAAVKVIPVGNGAQSCAAKEQADLCFLLKHPNIITAFRVDVCPAVDEDGKVDPKGSKFAVWILQEIINGPTLTQAVLDGCFFRFGDPDVSRVGHVLAQICRAVSYFHMRGVVHGDLTPSNILLQTVRNSDKGFVVKVGDFGHSRFVADHHKGVIGSTARFKPPEAYEASVQISCAFDAFSFGVTAWFTYMGEIPFHEDQEQAEQKVREGAGLAYPVGAPSCLSLLTAQCLRKDPTERPPLASYVQPLLDLASESDKPPATKPPVKEERICDAISELPGVFTPANRWTLLSIAKLFAAEMAADIPHRAVEPSHASQKPQVFSATPYSHGSSSVTNEIISRARREIRNFETSEDSGLTKRAQSHVGHMETFVKLRGTCDRRAKESDSKMNPKLHPMFLQAVAKYLVGCAVSDNLDDVVCGEEFFQYGPAAEITATACHELLQQQLSDWRGDPAIVIMAIIYLDTLRDDMKLSGYPLGPMSWQLVLSAAVAVATSLAFDTDIDVVLDPSRSVEVVHRAIEVMFQRVDLEKCISRTAAFRAYMVMHGFAVEALEQ
jgi:serine/threonine protein kinase